MSKSLLAKGLLGGAVAAAALAAAPTTANAGLTFDLRFADGTETKVATGPTSYQLDLWARVSGADTNHTNDGLALAYATLLSEQVGGGAVTGNLAGDSSGFVLVSPWFTGAGRDGTAANLNNDGFGDWGSLSPTATDNAYLFARSSNVTHGGQGTGQEASATDWEFKLATWTVNVTGVTGTGETRIAIPRPAFETGGGQDAYAVYYDDAPYDARTNVFQEGSQSTVTTGSNAGVYGDYVTITAIPEPTSLALAGLIGAGLLGRRRRS